MGKTVLNSPAREIPSDTGSRSTLLPSTSATRTPTNNPASGLQIEELVVGTGELTHPGATATVHYTVWLLDGTEVYSSADRGSPYQFVIGQSQFIKGWDEGVRSMRIGGKRKLTIPPELAYGNRGLGSAIPPGATLVFEVELLQIR